MKSSLPTSDEFSTPIGFKITRKQTNEIKKNKDRYKFLPDNINFDFLPIRSKEVYEIEFRV